MGFNLNFIWSWKYNKRLKESNLVFGDNLLYKTSHSILLVKPIQSIQNLPLFHGQKNWNRFNFIFICDILVLYHFHLSQRNFPLVLLDHTFYARLHHIAGIASIFEESDDYWLRWLQNFHFKFLSSCDFKDVEMLGTCRDQSLGASKI